MDAMLLRMDRLECTTDILKEKLKQPSTPTRHEKFLNVDATSIPPSPHPANHDFDAPKNAQSDHDSTDDVIPYMTTVTVRIGNITHYHCQVRECIKRGDGTFYRVMNNVGSDFIVQMNNIMDLDKSTVFPPHSSYVNQSHRPPRSSSYGGRGHAPPSRHQQSFQDHAHHNRSHDAASPRHPQHYPDHGYYDDDDNSNDRRSHHILQKLGRNEDEYPIGIRCFIKEDKVESILKTAFDPLKPDADPREFYNKICLTISKYGLLLCAYADASPSASLLAFDATNSLNFEAAETRTARVLYDIFEQGQDILFHPENYYHLSIIKNYRESQDGLALMKKFISHHHPNFSSTQKRSNISTQYQLPQLKSQSLILYISALKIWIDETNPMMTPLAIFQLVLDQLKQEPQYAKARYDLETHSDRYITAKVTSVDAQHTLARLADTILDYYSKSEKNSILKPTSSALAALAFPHPPPVKLDIRSMVKPSHGRDRPQFGKNKSHDKPLYCYGCRTNGHEVKDCKCTGAQILVTEFLAKFEPERKLEIREEYLKNRRLAHEKYLQSHKDRGTLKKHIKAIEATPFPTNVERENMSESGWASYIDLGDIAINKARIHYLHLDFGSLNTAYDDFAEPMLDFNPDTEEFEA